MTDQRELDRLLDAFFVDGHDELADRVIDAALEQIRHTRQRRALRIPRRFQAMPMLSRLSAAAVIGVLLIGGALYLSKPSQTAVVGVPSPTANASTSQPTPTPTRPPTPTPTQASYQTPDIPALAGPLVVGRQVHTSTALVDGRVLVAGGLDNKDAAIASAVIYDPRTNAFSPTGSLAAARGAHSATLLGDGRVLIAGGGPPNWVNTASGASPYDGSYLTSAELYDPATGRFSATGSMTTARENHTATLLADGRVLIAGGNDAGWHAVASAELYDPKTGRFSPTGSMATARAYHTATLLADGRVLIAGGDPAAYGSGGPVIASAELYDPKTGKFTAIGTMTDQRVYHTATLLSDGRVLVVGGGGDYANRNFLASAELYDPKTGRFSATGSMADTRTYLGATLLADGRVLVTGGFGAQAPLASAEIYDPKTGTFSPAGSGR